MKIKSFLYTIAVLLIVFNSCVSAPKDFTNYYTGENTGLDTIIDINGYFVAQRECDSSFYSVFMFYPDGLFTIATASQINPELIDCFMKGGNSDICNYPLWGTYYIDNDTIKTQVIREEGVGVSTIFRDYEIENGRLINIREYINPEKTKIGNMRNYPSFYLNKCPEKIKFHSFLTKRDKKECPLLRKKWFNKAGE